MKSFLEHAALQYLAISLFCLVGFGRALSRYFVSEDFVILRVLANESFWSVASLHLKEPVLGLAFSHYYRPVTYFLLALEYLAWGTVPAAYLWTHLAIHVLNAIMVHRLAIRWGISNQLSLGIALVFAVYPLHPNTVVFIASFATLCCTGFLLASLLLYERHRGGDGARALAGSALCFALALGSYELAVILPLLVLAREILLDGRWEVIKEQLFSVRLLVLGSVLGLYVLARFAVLGTVGGTFWAGQLAGIEITRIMRILLENAARLAIPTYGDSFSDLALLVVGGLLFIVSMWSVAGIRRRRRSAQFWLFGLLWAVASQAPFGFSLVVPGTGRYWYLTSIGLAIMVAAATLMLVDALVASGLRLRAVATKAAVTSVMTVVSLGYLVLLVQYAGAYAEAGEITRSIQGQLADLRQRGDRQIFVTGHPVHLRLRGSVPAAQVFQWGLTDALEPPFIDPGLIIYPLPELTDADFLPLQEQADLGEVWRWSPTSRSLVRASFPGRSDVQRIASSVSVPSAHQPLIRFRAVPDARHRLVLITRGGSRLFPLQDVAAVNEWSEAQVPGHFVRWMNHLYGSRIYAWIEARTSTGRLLAIGHLLVIEPTAG